MSTHRGGPELHREQPFVAAEAQLVLIRRTQVNELSSVVELHPPVRTTGLKLGVPLKTRHSADKEKEEVKE